MKIKLLTACMALIVSPAFAVNTATGPNTVYIQQVGSSNLLTIEQVGGTDKVGGVTNTTSTAIDGSGITTLTPADPSSSNYGTITGSSNTLTITQHGSADQAQYNIQGGHNSYTSAITGDSNQTSLTVGDQNNASNNYNTVNETVIGNTNLILTNIVGSHNSSTTSITGNSNQVTEKVTTSTATVQNTVSGDDNVFNIQQTDAAGANGHMLVMNTTGNYNSVSTQQQGTNDTTVNINTTGSNNTITVRTSSGTIASPVSAIAR